MTTFTTLRADWEHKYVSDFVLTNYPNDEHRFRCPLGTVPELWLREMGVEKAIKTYRPYRPEVDAVVITKDKIVVIEGKLFKVLDGLAKLPIYASLVAETPEFQEYKTLQIEAVLVTPKEPQWEKKIAKDLRIRVEIFIPEWIEEYYAHQEKYWTKEERMKRMKRKEVLKGLGY